MAVKFPNVAQIGPENYHPKERQQERHIEYIILHAMAEFIDFDGGMDYFGPDYLNTIGLSCHYFVTPSGVILQSVPEGMVAYHAKGYNTYSIGIEVLVPGLHTYETFLEAIKGDYVTTEAKMATVHLLRGLRQKYLDAAVVTHHMIDPKRKVDPGEGFPLPEVLEKSDPRRKSFDMSV